MMELFEVPPEGVVTRKEFVDRVIDIFVQRRSLQLTLGDYEVRQNRARAVVFRCTIEVFGCLFPATMPGGIFRIFPPGLVVHGRFLVATGVVVVDGGGPVPAASAGLLLLLPPVLSLLLVVMVVAVLSFCTTHAARRAVLRSGHLGTLWP